MNPIPAETRDRWSNRAEPEPGTGAVYWHMLWRDNPAVRAAATKAQARLAAFGNLHMTPEEWLHSTALVAGTTDDISGEHLDLMLAEAQRLLSEVRPIDVALCKVFYHPEAITLGFTPEGVLDPIHTAVQQATIDVTGRAGSVTGPARWTPHVTISYSTGRQPMAPLVAALGREVPRSDITVRAVSLVIQWGSERLWDWQPVGTVTLGGGLVRSGVPSPSARSTCPPALVPVRRFRGQR